jgi:hypothetical protein
MWTAVALLALTCGSERWDVKTLSDPTAASVQLDHPQEAKVADLRKLPAPTFSDQEPRTAAEKTVYTMEAYVLGYMQETDEDFHVVIADDPKAASGTMVVEIPAADCVQTSVAKNQIDAARAAFTSMVQSSPPKAKYRPLRQPLKVTLTGVAFFDKLHGQKGVAPNGVELHPVLSVARAH